MPSPVGRVSRFYIVGPGVVLDMQTGVAVSARRGIPALRVPGFSMEVAAAVERAMRRMLGPAYPENARITVVLPDTVRSVRDIQPFPIAIAIHIAYYGLA